MRFGYGKMDSRARKLTTMWFALIAATIGVVWYFFGEGGYTVAWGTSMIGAVVLLVVLSVPRRIVLTASALELRCVVEIIHIGYDDLRRVRKLDAEDMKGKVPILGSYGFFGYFGYYVDTNSWEGARLYCTHWGDFVEITDSCERRYVISCPEADELIRALDDRRESGPHPQRLF